MSGDKYYGPLAHNYDAARRHTKRWAIEQAAIEELVTSGPVLDVPVGTGRYVGIYNAKRLSCTGVDISGDMIIEARRKYPDLDVGKGSVFDLPFKDGAFATAVCTRLLDWLSPADMARAVAELRRVAQCLVVSIRHGREGELARVPGNYTHGLDSFYRALDGLFIEARRLTEQSDAGTEEIFKLRPPAWADVVEQFRHDDGRPESDINRIAGYSAEMFDLDAPQLSPATATVRAEYWAHDRLWTALTRTAEWWDHKVAPESRYVIDDVPRHEGGPATILTLKEENLILDGRRRINQWAKTPGLYPVLVVEPK